MIRFDPSYISKSDNHTPNVGYLYSGVAGMIKRGMELGCLAIIDVKQITAYHLDAVQTPPVKKNNALIGLINHYWKIFTQRISTIKKHSRILVVDGWFNKQQFVNAMTQLGLKVIGRWRPDETLKCVHNVPKNEGEGRPKKFLGKVNITI